MFLFCGLQPEFFSPLFSLRTLFLTFFPSAVNGVVIATEKKLPPLMDETSVQKIAPVTDRIGMVYSGMGPDFRVLLRKARKKAEQYHRFFKDPIPVTILVQEVANIMQEYTQSGYVSPIFRLSDRLLSMSLRGVAFPLALPSAIVISSSEVSNFFYVLFLLVAFAHLASP